MELRSYQREAQNAVLSEWGKGVQRTLLVLPTGTGKTVVFASVINERVRRGGRALVLAHRGELLDQAADKIKAVTGLDCAYEKAEQSALGTDYAITVGSIQSLANLKRLERFPSDYYSTIVVDEAHHCIADTYKRVLDHFKGANILGVTATPDRGDKQNLAKVFDSLAYEYSIATAIKEGYLSHVIAKMMPLQIDIKNVSVTAGDYQADELSSAIEPYLEEIASLMVGHCQDRKKIVVFLPLISTSLKMCNILNEYGFRCAEVNGNSENRAQIISDFANGKYNVLCNSMLLTEGWDCPSVDCIVVLRPTRSRALYQQMVGRGMRLSPEKKDLVLLDFLWMTEKHSLCRPSALISQSAEIAQKIDQMSTEGDIDLTAAEAKAERDIIEEREGAIAKELQKQRCRRAKTVDPIQYVFSIADEEAISYESIFEWQKEEPSEKQNQALEAWGLDSSKVKDRGHASMLIQRLQDRRAAGLCSPKQIRLLERYGFKQVGTWSKEEASDLIGRISANNWHVPNTINPKTYRPETR